MRALRFFVAVVVGGLVVLGTASGAGADCGGPTIEHTTGTVDRGQPITVHGEGFGDSCYDTGPPPPGEDILGKPLQNVEIVFVQGGKETVAASGGADRDYAFEVEVPLPPTLAPGDVTVEARWGDGGQAFNATTEPLVVSDAPARRATEGDDGDSTSVWLIAAAAAAAAAVAGGAAVWFRRRSPTPE